MYILTNDIMLIINLNVDDTDVNNDHYGDDDNDNNSPQQPKMTTQLLIMINC